MKLLIAGLPGTGKTTFGNYLRDVEGFTHVDMETEGPKHFPPLSDVVCTFGFIPDDIIALRFLDDLKFAGYSFIWLEGSEKHSYKRYIKREGNNYFKNYLYFRQVFKIREHKPEYKFKFKIFSPFKNSRSFKDAGTLFEEIKKAISSSAARSVDTGNGAK